MKLAQIITQEQASHIQTTAADMITLYRHSAGQAQKLSLSRVGAGLRNRPNVDFQERNDWFRIGTEEWEPVGCIPTDHALWPAKPV